MANRYMPCPSHPRYLARRKPLSNCELCWLAWFRRCTDEGRDDHQMKLLEESGHFEDSRLITHFIYLIMRDHMPVGNVAMVVDNILRAQEYGERTGKDDNSFTNGWLGRYAAYLTNRLTAKK